MVYGYYLYTKPNGSQEYVYLVYDPWDPVVYQNNIHLDIWRQSWTNIMNEKNSSVDTDRVPVGSYYSNNNYYANWFMWCE